MREYVKDAVERILWTSVSAAASAAAVYINDLPEVWIPVGTVLLTTVKVLIAKKIGDPNTAALAKG
jgi:hypothetical protein